jgi:hypothetical protein
VHRLDIKVLMLSDARCKHKKKHKYFIFTGPCSVIYSYNKNQRDALISQIYFRNRTLQVSASFSVHHQESSNVHTAIGICHTGYADCLLAGSGCSILIPLAKNCRNLKNPTRWKFLGKNKDMSGEKRTYATPTINELLRINYWLSRQLTQTVLTIDVRFFTRLQFPIELCSDKRNLQALKSPTPILSCNSPLPPPSSWILRQNSRNVSSAASTSKIFRHAKTVCEPKHILKNSW